MGDRQEHAIRVGMTLRKIIRHHGERVGSDVLHALLQGVGTEHKGFSEDRKGSPTETKQTGNPLWEMVPIRTHVI